MNKFIFTLLFLISNILALKGEVFSGAKWIGAPGDDLPFYAHYLPEFKIEYEVILGENDNVAFIYGANDARLLNRNMNIYNIESQPDSTFIKVEVSGEGKVNVYRAGYHPKDMPNVPFKTFETDALKPGKNHIGIVSDAGQTQFWANGKKIGDALLNPIGRGGDYIAFPVVGDMAVEIPENGTAKIENIEIRNFREPGNIIYAVPEIFSNSAKINLLQRSMPELRTDLDISSDKDIKSAVANITARGIYDLKVNGKRVNKEYFNPGSTQYNRTHLYQTFDLKPYLKSGKNEIAVQLAEGWWSGGATFNGGNWNFFGDRQSLLAAIDIKFDHGEMMRLTTTPSEWEYSVDGPLVEGSFFQGEIYDATRESSERRWKPAAEIALDSTVNKSVGNWDSIEITPSYGDKVLAVDTLQAITMTEPRAGVYVYDLGQNMAGVPMIDFSGLDKGQEVTLRYAEVLYPDLPDYAQHKGMIMTENLRAAMCRDIYRAKGDGQEIFSPRFTLHGFRFIEISGIDKPLPLVSVKALPLSSVHDFKAHYECSDSLVNRLWENIKWSTRSNFVSIPTDCPQRNERLGWMGDISVFAPTATKLADVQPLLRQYMRSVRDCQSENGRFPDVAPTGYGFGGLLWGSAGITVPWEMYKAYGDTVTLREHYPAMKRYIDYVLKETIEPSTGVIVQNRAWGDLADWLSPEYDKSDKSLLWECYFIYDLELMTEMARILGYEEDANNYDALRNERIDFFKNTYIDPATEKTIWSAFDEKKKGEVIDTQVSYALPIAMGIYNSPKFTENFLRTVSRTNIADDGKECPPYTLMTGFIGTAWIMDALSKTGNTDYAYRLLTSRDYPSWLYPVTQGATTVWERLNSYTHTEGFGKNNSMNSFNHYSFGSVGNWLITHSLGLNMIPAESNDYTLIVSPEADLTGKLTSASGWLETPFGKVKSSWEIKKNKVNHIQFKIALPKDFPSGINAVFSVKGYTKKLKPGLNTFMVKIRVDMVCCDCDYIKLLQAL